METIETLIQQIGNLPSSPRILSELLPLVRSTDVDSERIIELISYDPALTAKLLRRCNSAAMALEQPVLSIADAVTYMGFSEIYRLVALVVGQGALGGPQQGYGMAAGGLWQHSAVAAIAAKNLAESQDTDASAVFTCALLHDIGKLLLNSSVLSAYPAISDKIVDSGQSFQEAEKSVIGMEHGELGGRILSSWNFPDKFVRAVWHHHDPIKARPYEQMAAYIHFGDIIAHTLGYGDGHHSHATRTHSEVLEILEITPSEIENSIVDTDTAIRANDWFLCPES